MALIIAVLIMASDVCCSGYWAFTFLVFVAHLWCTNVLTRSLSTLQPSTIQSPVLLPTVSDVPRTDFASVKDYFDSFLLKKPQGEILDGHINIGDGWASDVGIYEVRRLRPLSAAFQPLCCCQHLSQPPELSSSHASAPVHHGGHG